MSSLIELTRQLAGGTRRQKQRTWRMLSAEDRLWSACQLVLREPQPLPDLVRAYESLTGNWDRACLLPERGEYRDHLDEQLRAAQRLVAAAIVTAAVRDEASPDTATGWALGAAGVDAGRIALAAEGGRRGPAECRIRTCFSTLQQRYPGQVQALAAAQDASLGFLWSLVGVDKRPERPRVRVPILLARGNEGYVAWLWLEQVPGGCGQLFQAPSTALGGVLPDLRHSVEGACATVRPELRAKIDVAWWFTDLPEDADCCPIPVGGRSAGAAAAVALTHLLHSREVRTQCAISATLLPGGWLGEVEGLEGAAPKLHAARRLATEREPATVVVGPGSQLSGATLAEWTARGVRIIVAHTLADAERISGVQDDASSPGPCGSPETRLAPPSQLSVTVLYAHGDVADRELCRRLERQLRAEGADVRTHEEGEFGIEWARAADQRIRGVDVVLVLLTAAALSSEMLAYEVQLAQDAAQTTGKPRQLYLRIDPAMSPGDLSRSAACAPVLDWSPDAAPSGLLEAMRRQRAPLTTAERAQLVPPTGVLPLTSRYYLERDADEQFRSAAARGDSIVRIKGARQMGKTSLLARGLQQAREQGATILLTDFQLLNQAHLESVDVFFLALARWLAPQAAGDLRVDDLWDPRQGPSVNFRDFLLELLERLPGPVVWGLDEVDRLFQCSFHSEVFGLLRSLHNDRALHPDLPWSKLTLTLCYATEAQLFLADLNQSPFNVGTRIRLDDFSPAEVAELNYRYGVPLGTPAELAEYYDLFAGHPYLTHQGFHELVTRELSLAELKRLAVREQALFGDHLRRMLRLLTREEGLLHAIRELLAGHSCPTAESFYRLWSAGVVVGDSARDASFRCRLYATYLERHL